MWKPGSTYKKYVATYIAIFYALVYTMNTMGEIGCNTSNWENIKAVYTTKSHSKDDALNSSNTEVPRSISKWLRNNEVI